MTNNHGATGRISQWKFEEMLNHLYSEVKYYSTMTATGDPGGIISFHYFNKDQRELGYWSPITKLGFIFETPRKWYGEYYERLSRVSTTSAGGDDSREYGQRVEN